MRRITPITTNIIRNRGCCDHIGPELERRQQQWKLQSQEFHKGRPVPIQRFLLPAALPAAALPAAP